MSANEVAWALQEVGERSQDVYGRFGLWPGRVEDVDDPQRLGRVRVRIFHLNGDKRSTPTTGLPWASVLSLGGGGFDYGSGGRNYIVGSTVMVAFQQGDERSPVVVGGLHGAPIRDGVNPVEYLTVDGQSQNEIEQTWQPEEGNEIPKDVFGDAADGDTHPTRTVWQKSYKGHTIMCEDRDGLEFLKIIDRAGQVIEMNCPVTEEENANNGQQRGNRNASNDTQLPQSALINQKAFIRLKDVGGQEILLDGSGGNEKIILRSRNRQGSSRQTVVISSAKGREKIEIQDKQGNRVTVDPNSAKESIVLIDYSGNKATFNAEDGLIEFRGSAGELHETGSFTATFDQEKTESIGGNETTRVLGNKFLDVMNDLTTSISGMTSAVFGGALQATLANTPASGVPATTALSVEIAQGGALISTVIGDLDFITAAGNIEVSTTLGNADFLATTGNVTVNAGTGNITVTATVGDAELGSLSSTTTIQGPLGISLGGVAAAFTICRGDQTASALNLISTVGVADVRVVMGIPVPPVSWLNLPALLQPFITAGTPLAIQSQIGSVKNTTI